MTVTSYLRSYNALSASESTLIFFEYKGLVYIHNRKHVAPRWVNKDRESSSHGCGEKFRIYISQNERARLVKSSTPVMTIDEFDAIPYANKGHKCEYWLHKACNLGEYAPDHVRFDKAGDVCINGIKYQIKFQNASMTSVEVLHKAQRDARAKRQEGR